MDEEQVIDFAKEHGLIEKGKSLSFLGQDITEFESKEVLYAALGAARDIVAVEGGFSKTTEEGEDGEWREYKRTGSIEARPYIPGEDLSGVSVSDEDDPSKGDMIARNPENHDDKWLIDQEYFQKHYQ